MKKTVMLTAPLLVLAFYGTSQVTTAQGNCEPQETPPVCQNAQQITINNNSKNISPRNICVNPGDTLTVNVTPSGSTASVEGKDGGWPNNSGSSFELHVPESEGDYDYNVHFEDGSCIDPRITVRR